ncbi:hypothetical protein [Methanoregula sp.]|jgi:hypothetical protein|uniref:hypothetical protein n=1 Tax=Methanoregula sp. TaxID=2052170 RepID=UPI003C74D868
MTDFQTLREKHRKDSITSLTAFIFILIILFFEKQYVSLFSEIINSPATTFDLNNAGYVIFLTIVPTVLMYFIFFVTIARQDFYYTIDNAIFKRREQIDKFICLKLIDIQKGLTEGDRTKICIIREKIEKNGKINTLMQIFYKYIEKSEVVNPTLKQHAFIYWTDYFSSITLICFGIVFFLIYLIMTVIQFTFLRLIATIFVFL